MQIDIALLPSNDIRADAALIQQAERLGYGLAWTAEIARNPFFSLTIAAAATRRIRLGTWATAAFPRSPMVIAQIAWDLARQSDGRFTLGLQTDGIGLANGLDNHNTADQIARMREYIMGMRAIWDTFQTGARLRFRGDYYTFRLMAPFFNPGPIEYPEIPLFLSGANLEFCTLAAELCHGLHGPALHTRDYLLTQLLPALSRGLAASGRIRSDVELAVPVYVVSGHDDNEVKRAKRLVQAEVAAHALQHSKSEIIEHLGWQELVKELASQSAAQRCEAAAAAITDDVLDEVAIVAQPHEVLARIQDRYSGLADRVCLIVTRESRHLLETIALAND